MEALGEGRLAPPTTEVQEERRFFDVAVAVLLPLTFFRGLAYPNAWAATQAQIDYSVGFTKRGLFGALIARPLHLEHYGRFAVVSVVLLLFLLAATVRYALWAGIRQRFGTAMLLTVFVGSFIVTYMARLCGYLDIPLALITVLLLGIESAALRLALCVPMVTVALLIHEMYLIAFLPVLLLPFLLQARFAGSIRSRRAAFIGFVFLLVAAVAVTTGIALRASLSPAAVERLQANLSTKTDFRLYPLVFPVLSRSAHANVSLMREVWKAAWWWKDRFLNGTLAFLPLVLFFLGHSVRVIRRSVLPRDRQILTACVLCSCSPLAMNLLGWDADRWWALSAFDAFLVLCTVCRYLPGADTFLSPKQTRIALAVIALSLATGGPLIDGRPLQQYPFITPSLRQSLDLQQATPR